MFWFFMMLIPAALWYLGSRAVITQAIWSRYPEKIGPVKFKHLMDCSTCSGAWWGGVIFLVLCAAGIAPYSWYTAPGWGLCSMMYTPAVAYLHDQAMYRLGTVDDDASAGDGETRV
jgi:hypothetical protein